MGCAAPPMNSTPYPGPAAQAIAYQAGDNTSPEFRALGCSVTHQIDAAKALIEASLAGLKH